MSMPATEVPDPAMLLAFAKMGDRDAFQRLAEPYRRELQLHCYRMLGSFHDAEDIAQETFLRAWRGLHRFEGRASFRHWLYRIATNACLKALASRARARRVLPETQGPPSDQMPDGGPATEVAWLEPYPDTALEGIADAAPGPDARYEMREAVHLAFIAAIQHLPPRQRAVLLLRDVLGWSAIETARLLDASVASVNSALQRARATLEKGLSAGRPTTRPAPDDQQRALLARYVRAWESANVDGFVALLREDAVLNMPPWREWYLGREAIRTFFAWAWRLDGQGSIRLVPTAANRQPAFAFYKRGQQGPEWQARAIQLLTLRDESIAALTFFVGPELFAAFGLPPVLPPPRRHCATRVPAVTSTHHRLRRQDTLPARALLRWQFQRVHELLDAAMERLTTEAVHRHPPSTAEPAPARYAQAVVCEDLAVNGVLARGTPLALSTWIGRTGLNEMPPLIGTTDWAAWAHRVRLDLAQLRPYARAVYASTDAYIAALRNDAFDPAHSDTPAYLLSALLLSLSMGRCEIACLLALESGPTTGPEEAMTTQPFGEAEGTWPRNGR